MQSNMDRNTPYYIQGLTKHRCPVSTLLLPYKSSPVCLTLYFRVISRRGLWAPQSLVQKGQQAAWKVKCGWDPLHSFSCGSGPSLSARKHWTAAGRSLCWIPPGIWEPLSASWLCLFQAEQPQFLQPLLIGSISQPSVTFIALLWPLSKIQYLV